MAFFFVLGSLAFSTYLALNQPRRALLAAVFFVPWMGLDVELSVRVTAYLVLIVPLFAVSIFRSVISPPFSLQLGIFWLIVIYAVVWSASQLPYLPAQDVAGGALRQPVVRGITQILQFLITISPIWLVPIYIRRRESLLRMGQIYLASVAVLALIGWLQLAVWIVTSVDPIPVGFFNNLLDGTAVERSGLFDYMGSTFYRMSSFGGEPKGLGTGLAVALILLQSVSGAEKKMRRWLWPFFFVSMIATMSTMAILGWVGASVLQSFTSPAGSITVPRLAINRRIITSIFISVFSVGLVVSIAVQYFPIFDVIQMRTTTRIIEREGGALEETNVAVLDFLIDQPLWAMTGTGLGNVHLYAGTYLPEYARRYFGGVAFVAKSAFLRWVSELGLVTFLVFIAWFWRLSRSSIQNARENPEWQHFAAATTRLVLPIFSLWLVSGYITAQFYMMVGFCVALRVISKRTLIASRAA